MRPVKLFLAQISLLEEAGSQIRIAGSPLTTAGRLTGWWELMVAMISLPMFTRSDGSTVLVRLCHLGTTIWFNQSHVRQRRVPSNLFRVRVPL